MRLIPVMLALCLAAPAAMAQTVSPKAYAPEDLSVLREDDQIRVISREYSDQSGGRRIPDDQLEFYLDQIDSGWRFSTIKADIAQSLRGNSGSGGWNGNRPGSGQVVRCESVNERNRECSTGFRGRATLVRQHSRAACVEGRSWGQRPGMVWVNWGCRADFADSGKPWQGGTGYSVTCSSVHERYTTCAWQSGWGRPVVIERLSREECIEGRGWGYLGSSIWVDRGCRARFGPQAYDPRYDR